MEKLKPCPFCGNTAQIYVTLSGMYACGCDITQRNENCGIVVLRAERKDAIAAWNNRTIGKGEAEK